MGQAETYYEAKGVHILADISTTDKSKLDDLSLLESSMVESAITEGATVLSVQHHRFSPNGVTILVLLAESHVSIHTYPDEGKAFFDVFTCGDRISSEKIFRKFIRCLPNSNHSIKSLVRGTSSE